MSDDVMSDAELAALLHGATQRIVVVPPAGLWEGVEGRVPRARTRRVARRALLPAMAAVLVAAVVAGVAIVRNTGDVSLVPVSPPNPATETAPPLGRQLELVEFDEAESAQVVRECLASGRGPGGPSLYPVDDIRVVDAVRDNASATVILRSGTRPVWHDCDIPADTSGRLAPEDAFRFASTDHHILLPMRGDLEILLESAHEIAWKTEDEGTVHSAFGRVSPRVGRVTMTTPGGEVIEAQIMDGWFLVRSVQDDPPSPGPLEGVGDSSEQHASMQAYIKHLGATSPLIQAWGRDGRLLAEMPASVGVAPPASSPPTPSSALTGPPPEGTAPPVDDPRPVTFTPAEQAVLVDRCGHPGSVGVGGERSPAGDIVVAAAIEDSFGVKAVLVSRTGAIECGIPLEASGRLAVEKATYGGSSGGSTIDRRAPLVDQDIDVFGSWSTGFSEDGNRVEVTTEAGRVSDRVARLTFAAPGGEWVEVPIQRGAFVARLKWVIPPGGIDDYDFVAPEFRPVLRAYDKDGRLLAEYPPASQPNPTPTG